MTDKRKSKLKVGLALGGGSARGWSHIGVIRALADNGIEPDIVCGCSIGAIVGASYVAGNLDRLEAWVRALTRIELVRYFEVNLSLNGFVDRERLHDFFQEYVCDERTTFEGLGKGFATVSTELETGKEVWFQKGPVLDSVWASIALPGLFPPIQYKNKWLVDGGLVNPVPVSVCRAMGADIVIAVNLNGSIVGKHFIKPQRLTAGSDNILEKFKKNVRAYSPGLFANGAKKEEAPGLLDAITGAVHITQDRITRSRMAGDPPDILLSPRLSHVGLLEFYRAEEAIREGSDCVSRMSAEISYIMKHT